MVVVAPAIIALAGLLLAGVGVVVCSGADGVMHGEGMVFGFFGCVISVGAAVRVLALLVERLTTEFSCTDRRILIKSGLITTRLRDMPLAKVEALLMEQRLFGKLFGYGTLVFKGSGGTRRTCHNIEQPFDFYKRVQEQVAVAQKHK